MGPGGTKPRVGVLDANLTAILTRLFIASASHCLVGPTCL